MSDGILIAGDSHTIALVGHEGLPHADPPTVQTAAGQPGVLVLCGAWPRSAAYWGAVAAATETYAVAISWRGNEYNARFLIESARFDFLYHKRPDLPLDGTVIVPEALVRTSFLDVAPLAELLDRIREPRRVAIVAPPPPKPSSEFLRKRVLGPAAAIEEAYFHDTVRALGLSPEAVRITPPATRLKLWSVMVDEFERVAHARGVRFLRPPADAIDARGFLREEYADTDATHANRLYGALVIAQLCEAFGG